MSVLQLAIVVPTYQEKSNVSELVIRLEHALQGIRWEVIFVDDDSPDGTADLVRELAQKRPHVRVLQRIGRRGLSRAVIEGVLSTHAPVIAVMDADMQHDESLLPRMLTTIHENLVDIVVASRYCASGSIGEWQPARARVSKFASALSRIVVRQGLTDPVSGFFMIRREAFARCVRRLSGEGFKVLLDLFASSPEPLRYVEIPYHFRPRATGESKLDSAVALEYLLLIIDKKTGQLIPPRFVLFAFVGSTGLLVHLLVLWTSFRVFDVGFAMSQGVATVTAMTSNYALNNLITYRDSRRRGISWFTGLLTFYVVCGIGLAANVGIASALYRGQEQWLIAGAAGALIGTVWNYVASSVFTWKQRRSD